MRSGSGRPWRRHTWAREDSPRTARWPSGRRLDQRPFAELVGGADVLLAVGTELGAETTGQYGLRLSGRLVQIDADASRIGATYDAFGLVGDARAVLAELAERLTHTPRDDGPERAAAVRSRIAEALDAQDRPTERGLLHTVRDALPRDAVTSWDMTILAYWAAAHFPAYEPRTFLYPARLGDAGVCLARRARRFPRGTRAPCARGRR